MSTQRCSNCLMEVNLAVPAEVAIHDVNGVSDVCRFRYGGLANLTISDDGTISFGNYIGDPIGSVSTARTLVVEASTNITMLQTTRSILCLVAGITITLPVSSSFQQGKPYTVANQSTGTIFVVPSSGEQILGDVDTSLVSLESKGSREFFRHGTNFIIK